MCRKLRFNEQCSKDPTNFTKDPKPYSKASIENILQFLVATKSDNSSFSLASRVQQVPITRILFGRDLQKIFLQNLHFI